MVLVVSYWIPKVGRYDSRSGIRIGTSKHIPHHVRNLVNKVHAVVSKTSQYYSGLHFHYLHHFNQVALLSFI